MTKEQTLNLALDWLKTLPLDEIEGSYTTEIGECTVEICSYLEGEHDYQGAFTIEHPSFGYIVYHISLKPLCYIILEAIKYLS